MTTQLQASRAGEITEQMKAVGESENVSAEKIRDEIAKGHLIIPANKLHIENSLKPAGIGRAITTKVNANIGASSVRSSIDEEMQKLNAALEVGADAVMDLSTGENMDRIRQRLLKESPVMFGTVPIYQVIEGRGVDEIDKKVIMDVIHKQAKQGVDFFTIHAGILRKHLNLLENRVGGIVSRGGALLARWMLHHQRENPLYELFDEICDVMVEYDICFSLGDGLRPGAIADATDEAQLGELRTLGELTKRAQEKGCQVMVEGPGHVPFDQIQYNMEIQEDICNGAPFYVLGPIVTDVAPGYDHITSAIGGTAAAYYGASFLCYVTPREHLGLPTAEDVRTGVVASKIAAHAADVARKLPGADTPDNQISKARANLDWKTHLEKSLDPKTARLMHQQACKDAGTSQVPEEDFCSMCGKEWCSIRTNKEIRRIIKHQKKQDGNK